MRFKICQRQLIHALSISVIISNKMDYKIMSDTVTKNSLAKAVFYETGIPVTIAHDVIDSLFQTIILSTVDDGKVKIPKFGSFYVNNKKTRVGRNLNTQEDVVIQARKVVSFRPSNQLKQAVNEVNKL